MNAERWDAGLALAARLGIAPDAFWRLSVVEWCALARASGGPAAAVAPLTRTELEALMQDHPDTGGDDG